MIAGALKVGHPTALALTIAAMRILPPPLIAPLAIILPYFEIALGIYLVIGLFTRAVAGIAAVQLLCFAAVIASVVARGIVTSCGCFGPADTAPATWLDVLRDLAFTTLTLPIIFAGPGRFSVDGRLHTPDMNEGMPQNR